MLWFYPASAHSSQTNFPQLLSWQSRQTPFYPSNTWSSSFHPITLTVPCARRFLTSPGPRGTLPPAFILSGSHHPFILAESSLPLKGLPRFPFPTTHPAYFLHSSYLYLFCYTFYSRIKVAREQGTCLPCSSHHCILLIVSVWHQRHLGNIWCVNQTLGTKLASMSILVFFSGAFRPLTCSS